MMSIYNWRMKSGFGAFKKEKRSKCPSVSQKNPTYSLTLNVCVFSATTDGEVPRDVSAPAFAYSQSAALSDNHSSN